MSVWIGVGIALGCFFVGVMCLIAGLWMGMPLVIGKGWRRRTPLSARAAELPIYAVLVSGERVSDVTTNKLRAVALAREHQARGKVVECWEYHSAERVKFE